MKKRVLVVNEDLEICKKIKYNLQNTETDVSYVTSALEAFSCFLKFRYHLVIMDIRLSEANGLTLLEQMRTAKNVPILILSSQCDTTAQIKAIHVGADMVFESDSVCLENLLAHAHALIRRYTVLGFDDSTVYTLAFSPGLVIDPDCRTVTLNGELLSMTRKEFDILFYLASNAGRVLCREEIYLHVWSDDNTYNVDEAVKYHIKTLRKKLNKKWGFIETVWGIGYRFKEHQLREDGCLVEICGESPTMPPLAP